MTKKPDALKVVDVDQVFPLLTTDGTSRTATTTATNGDQGPVVSSVLRDVLGWRPRVQDTKAFIAALDATFTLTEFEGHVESTYVARGFAMDADLGFVSGGQASLYTRARAGSDQITPILDSLTALRPDADVDDCEAFRTLVRHQVTSLVGELGSPGGPRQQLVDSAFAVLAGPVASTTTGSAAVAGVTGDNIPGQLGSLRDRFGLIDANCNTVEDERVRTSYWTLVDLVLDLRRSWQDQKAMLVSGAGNGFLGTDLVVISRLLAAAAEQVDELESVLDSTLVSAAERQTLMLQPSTGLSLDGLLSWLHDFLTQDGPMYIRDTGRDGILTAFAPQLQALLDAFHSALMPLLTQIQGECTCDTPDDCCCPVTLLPASCDADYPAGMYSARSRIAFADLCRLLTSLYNTAARLSRYPGVVLFDVRLESVTMVDGGKNADVVRVIVRGANLRDTYLPAFVQLDKSGAQILQLPLDNTGTTSGDALSALFRFDTGNTPPEDLDGWSIWSMLNEFPSGILLPAEALPIAIVDGSTGRTLTNPRVYPSLKEALTPRQLTRKSGEFDWRRASSGSAFTSAFAGASPTAPPIPQSTIGRLEKTRPARPRTPLGPPSSTGIQYTATGTKAFDAAVNQAANDDAKLQTLIQTSQQKRQDLATAKGRLRAGQAGGVTGAALQQLQQDVADARTDLSTAQGDVKTQDAQLRRSLEQVWKLRQPTYGRP